MTAAIQKGTSQRVAGKAAPPGDYTIRRETTSLPFSTLLFDPFPNFFSPRELGKEAGDCHSSNSTVNSAITKTQSTANKLENGEKKN